MKTIKIFLASSEELKDERLEMTDLVSRLNQTFKGRGIQLELKRWEYLDSSMGDQRKQDEYNDVLRECDICLVLFWRRFGSYTGEELDVAYQCYKNKHKPEIYVFFKNPDDDDVTTELKEFTKSYESRYGGHFFNKFLTVDSLKLEFLLQFELYQKDQLGENAIEVRNEHVYVDNEMVADLNNIPFAANNEGFKKRQAELKELEEKIEQKRKELDEKNAALQLAKDQQANLPDVAGLQMFVDMAQKAVTETEDGLQKLLNSKKQLKDEFEREQQNLFNTARRITEQRGQKISDRMARAIEAFESGDAQRADIILDEAERDFEEARKDFRITKKVSVQALEEQIQRASYKMSNDSIPIEERVAKTLEIYEEADAFAQEINYDQEKYIHFLWKYSGFLSDYARYDKALEVYSRLIKLCEEFYGKEHTTIRRRHQALTYLLADGYIEDPSNISNLNEWIEDPKEQFIVLRGDVGIGKSALIAYWLREQYKIRPDRKVIWHCVAYASDKKDNGEAVRKRLTAEISDLYQLPNDTKLEALLEMIQDKEDLLIIIDGLEKFTTNDGSKQLLWMPRMPKNVKVMLTTTPDDESMESLSYRHWLCLTLPPLSIQIRNEIIQKYLIKFGKKLTEAQVDKIANTKLFENTSALMSLLNELVSFGDYYQLDQHLDRYVQAQSLAELYELILSRCEQDYGEQLVKEVLSFFWVSRKGLSESEIMQAANLIQLSWSQFYCAFSTHFNRRDGLLYISNPILKEAIYQRYLSNESESQYRRRLTKIFKEHVAGHDCSELCYQYFQLQDDDALYREILDFNVYYYTASNSEQEPNSIWSRLLASDPDKYKFEAYLEIWPTNPTQTEISAMAMIADLVWKRFENFKLSTKMLALALEAQRALSGEISQKTCDIEMEVANMLYDVRKLDSAWKIYQQVLEKRKKIYGDIHPKIAFTYEMMGHVLNWKKDYDAAEDLYTKAFNILSAIYNRPHYKIAEMIHNLATVQDRKGNYDKAATLYNKAITMWHQTLGNLSSELVSGYNMLAGTYIKAEKWSEAWESLVSCIIRCEKIYSTKHSLFLELADSLERVWHILEKKGLATDKQRKDYEIYLSGMVIKAHIKENGPAFQKGLRGTYDVLQYANWNISKPQSFLDEQKLMVGKKKSITLYKKGQIVTEHFDGPLGIIFERVFDANLHDELAKVYMLII